MNATQQKSSTNRAGVGFIFVTVLLDMLTIGIVIPVLPKLVVDFEGGNAGQAAQIYGLFGTTWALMQFLFSPVQGALSDHFGRRPVILISNLGLGLASVFMALAPSLAWLFVARVISGITAASISTAFAYVADVSAPEERSARFGLLGAAFGLGFIIGPAVGGICGSVEPRLPFWIAAGLSLANALYGFLVLPESLAPERRGEFSWRRANPMGSLILLHSRSRLPSLAIVSFLGNLAQAALPSVGVIYMIYRYGWDERMVGFTMAGVGLCAVAVQGGLIRFAVPRFGERATLVAGLLFGVAGFVCFGLAPTSLLFWLAIPVVSMGGLAGPSVQALMSSRLNASEQGQLQGANSSITGISNLIGPGLFSQTFAWFIAPEIAFRLPGAPFLLAAAILAVASVIAWRSTGPE
jgi:DHA1 family tetracycline resistance protein-like MFS transporter